MHWIRAISIFIVLVLLVPAHAQTVEEPLGDGHEGYRHDTYRAPVPDTLQGAKVVDVNLAYELWETGDALFIDVFPSPPKPKNIDDPKKWQAPKRDNIKGGYWLANVGFGALHETYESYFKDNLERLTKGDKAVGLVIYCKADCWMSWNAAKRALTYGYENVYWFPGGTDEWELWDYPLEKSRPIPQ